MSCPFLGVVGKNLCPDGFALALGFGLSACPPGTVSRSQVVPALQHTQADPAGYHGQPVGGQPVGQDGGHRGP